MRARPGQARSAVRPRRATPARAQTEHPSAQRPRLTRLSSSQKSALESLARAVSLATPLRHETKSQPSPDLFEAQRPETARLAAVAKRRRFAERGPQWPGVRYLPLRLQRSAQTEPSLPLPAPPEYSEQMPAPHTRREDVS